MTGTAGASKLQRLRAAFGLLVAITLPTVCIVIVTANGRRAQVPPPAPVIPVRAVPAAPSRALPDRIPWTTSRLVGSPEPPAPYRTTRAFPNLKFHAPVDVDFAPGVRDRVFLLDQTGKLWSFPDREDIEKADLLLDVSKVKTLGRLPDVKGTHEAYGFTFHPQFAKNRYVYVCYTLAFGKRARNYENGSRISRFTVSETDPPTADPASEVIVLEWLQGGHNGCCLKFGPDGYLYVSTGDAADPNPPDSFETGQDVSDLLASILRIDVDHPAEGKHYSVPPDNPFVNTPGARPEVYAYGLRNPWRMSFDRQGGSLWVGDVGWELWESVYNVKPGGNFGWSAMEGPNPVRTSGKRGPTPVTPPAAAVSHVDAASMTGGVVYRGAKLPGLAGHYVFGDWQTSRIWAAKVTGEHLDQLEPYREIALTDHRIVSFVESPGGDLFVLDYQGGGLWRLVPNDAPPDAAQRFPRKLSETGLFSSTMHQTPEPGVIPFDVNAAQWVDGATAERWVAVPGTGRVSWGKGVWGEDKPAWPADSVLARTLSLEARPGDPSSRRRVETQILHFDGLRWQGYSYAWNEQQTDAELVGAAGDDRPVPIPVAAGSAVKRTWHFPSRAQCMTCHNVWCDYTLAMNDAQVDRPQAAGGVTDNGVRLFRHLGLLLEPKPRKKDDPPLTEKPALTDPYNASADLNERARSYLHVNCSHCHRFGGGGTALLDVRKELSLDKTKLVDVVPNLGDFGLDDGRLVCPGDPARSVLLYRMAKLGRGRMPHIGSEAVDARGVQLMWQWQADLGRSPAAPPATGPAAAARIERTADLVKLSDLKTAPADAADAIDRLLASPSGALRLLEAVQSGALPKATADAATTKGLAWPHEPVRDVFRRFEPPEQQASRLGANINPGKLLALPGDAARGRKVFFGADGGGLCARCHAVGGQGVDFGPNLSKAGAKYNRADLLDHVLNPSKAITPGFVNYVVKTKDGDVLTGFVLEQNDKGILLKDPLAKTLRLPASAVEKVTPQPVSAMPDGLLADLEAQQAADLLAFLASLK